jgi:nicotinamidase-related amidase
MPRSALIVIDMLNRYEHDDAEPLRESVRAVIEPMARLVAKAKEAGACLVYVNDNPGDWAYLLREREVEHIILVGQVTEQCILYSALDGYIRHFGVTSHATPSPTSTPTSPRPRSR